MIPFITGSLTSNGPSNVFRTSSYLSDSRPATAAFAAGLAAGYTDFIIIFDHNFGVGLSIYIDPDTMDMSKFNVPISVYLRGPNPGGWQLNDITFTSSGSGYPISNFTVTAEDPMFVPKYITGDNCQPNQLGTFILNTTNTDKTANLMIGVSASPGSANAGCPFSYFTLSNCTVDSINLACSAALNGIPGNPGGSDNGTNGANGENGIYANPNGTDGAAGNSGGMGINGSDGSAGDDGYGYPPFMTFTNCDIGHLYCAPSPGGNGGAGGAGGDANGGNGGNGGNGLYDDYMGLTTYGGNGGAGGNAGTPGAAGNGGNGGSATGGGGEPPTRLYLNSSFINYLYRKANKGLGGAAGSPPGYASPGSGGSGGTGYFGGTSGVSGTPGSGGGAGASGSNGSDGYDSTIAISSTSSSINHDDWIGS